MRISALVLGFSGGAYVMWKVASPLPDALPSCLAAADCAPPPAVTAPPMTPLPPPPLPQGLRVVLYDPALEPLSRMADARPHILGWISSEDAGGAEGVTAVDGSEPAAPARFRIVGLGQAGAQGACAVFDGRKLQCVAILKPQEE